MVAPNTGDESVSYTIYINILQARKALDEIMKSEASVAIKTEELKNVIIGLAIGTNTSIEKAAQSLKKYEAAFTGTSKAIIDAAAKLAKIQLLPTLPDVTKKALQSKGTSDIAEEKGIADALLRIRISSAQEAQKYEQARHQEAMRNAEAEKQKAMEDAQAIKETKIQREYEATQAKDKAATTAQVNAELIRQANEKIAASIRNIVTANIPVEEKVKRLRDLILQMARDSGKSIEQVTAEIKKMDAAFVGTSKSVVDLASKAAKQQLFPTQPAAGFTSTLSSLGTVGQFVFGTVLGVTAVSVLRNIIEFFQGATDAAVKFNQQLYQFEVGVRASQRSGLDVTLASYNHEIDELQKKYPIFSRQDLYEGYSQVLLLARSLKFTEEQIRQIIDVSATASVVMGRDFGETATGITKSLSSGWFEAAQRAGFLISRQRVVDEGLKLNIENAKHGYNAMTEYERALAALSTYVKENKVIQEDTTLIMETQAGKILTAQAAWENFQLAVGQTISPLKAIGAERFTALLTVLDHVAQGWLVWITLLITLQKTIDTLQSRLWAIAKVLADAFNVHPIQTLIEGFRIWGEFFNAIWQTAVNFLATLFDIAAVGTDAFENLIPNSVIEKAKALFTSISEFFRAVQDLAGVENVFDLSSAWNKALEEAQSFTGLDDILGDLGRSAGSKLAEGMEEGIENSDIADAFERLTFDIYDEMTKLQRRIEQLWIDFGRRIQDIMADMQRAINRENAEYARSVANAELQFANRRAEAERKYRINEINAEARFQEQLRQLRTRFLFDLEDALRERDARQVLRLTRQYRMDRENTINEARLAADERRRAFEEELRQIAQQRAEKLRMLAEEHAIELQQIRENARVRIEEARLRYLQEKEDAQRASDARIRQQILDFQRLYGLTETQARALVSLLNSYFGTSGPVAQIYRNLVGYIMALVGAAAAALRALNQFGAPPTPRAAPRPIRAAQGGTYFADRPTQAVFGEAGPEYATFTPVSQISQHQQNVNQAMGSVSTPRAGASPGGMLRLMLGLSPDLRVEIMNDTLYEVSTVVQEVNRTRQA